MGWLLLQMKKIVLRCVFVVEENKKIDYFPYGHLMKSLLKSTMYTISNLLKWIFYCMTLLAILMKKIIKRLKKTVSGGYGQERDRREISVLQDIERRHLLSIVAWGFEMREKCKGPY